MSNGNYQSVLKLERLMFEDIQYTRDIEKDLKNASYEMNFTRHIAEDKDKTHFRVSLTANIWSTEEDAVKLKLTLVGFFQCDIDNEELKQGLIFKNAIAILFPYLRSQISLVTTQPDIPPIALPAMNIVAMFEEAESKNE